MPATSAGQIAKTQRQPTAGEKAEHHYRTAIDFSNRGLLAEAANELRLALQNDPAHIPARQFLIKLLLDQKATAQGMEVLREGINGNPRQTQWAMLLAQLELAQGDAPGAWSTLEKGLPAAGNNGEYQAFAGALLRQLEQPERAAGHYRQALALAPREGRWWVGLGLALEAAGHSPEAQESFRQASLTGNLTPELKAFVERKLR